jgi:hypothetical protein
MESFLIYKKMTECHAWWYMSIIPALRRKRRTQEDHKFEASLVFSGILSQKKKKSREKYQWKYLSLLKSEYLFSV